MANAAAKKAAAARQSASASYLPIVVVSNACYLLLRFVYLRNSTTAMHCIVAALLVALSFAAYRGILEDHANTIPGGGGGKGRVRVPGGPSDNALAGGASLDLLGLVVLIQYGTVFVSEKMHWLLLLLPVWAIWNLYSNFLGGSTKITGGRGGGGKR
ncbi:hypothetical protein ACHAXA_007208 [Cyclostephanos tholiformis]|uniref:Transmembrane protein 208 n=1 Tax=Cyclostephanos tholiformis TaxID=382380 RepID=A0ABD3SGC0_9STRA